MVAPQPYPGVAYLRTLWRPSGTWWRLLVSVVLGTVALFGTALLAILLVVGVARAFGSDYSLDFDNVDAGLLLATNVGLAALIPSAMGIVWLLYGVRPRWVSSHRPGIRWQWLWFCTVMSAAVWSVLFVLATIGAAVDRSSPIDGKVFGFLAVVLFTTPLQAAGEEYLFRGLLLQSLGATRMPAWLCIVLSALLFATAHGQFDPPLFADRFVLGVALSWMAIRTGGLEAGIAIHAVKNLSVLIPASLLDEVDSALEPTGVTWVPLIVDVVLLSILLPWMLAMCARRRRDGRLLPGEPQPWLAAAEAAPLPPHYGYPTPGGVAPNWQAYPGWQPPPGPSGWAPYPQYPQHSQYPQYPQYPQGPYPAQSWQPPEGYPPGWQPPHGWGPPQGWPQQGAPPPYQGPPYGTPTPVEPDPRPPASGSDDPPDEGSRTSPG